MHVLVTGATGSVGAALIPRLAPAGHTVRAFARDPTRCRRASSEVVHGDAVTGPGFDEALDGIDVAYYLIHSMEPGQRRRHASPTATARRRERFAEAARRRRRAAHRLPRRPRPRRRAGLAAPGQPPRGRAGPARRRARGGRAARLDRHRRALALVSLPRAPRRARAGHAAARLARAPHAADRRARRARLPLAAATEHAVGGPLSLDIAGPDVVTYAQLVERIRDALLLGRPRVVLPFTMTPSPAAWPPPSPARTTGSSGR